MNVHDDVRGANEMRYFVLNDCICLLKKQLLEMRSSKQIENIHYMSDFNCRDGSKALGSMKVNNAKEYQVSDLFLQPQLI